MVEKIRCLIVDDDDMSRKMLEMLVQQVKSLQLVASCNNPLQAREVLTTQPIDLLFLDMEMPDLSGLELLKSLANYPEVIIASAKEQYALQAFDFEVTDYLLKPVVLDRFLKAVDRVEKRLAQEKDSYTTPESVFVKANNQIVGIRLADITWIEAYGDYVNIYTEKDRFIVHSTMKGIENKMPRDQFIRVHRSFIVRFDRIQAIEDTVVIIGKKLIPIGESYRPELMRRLNLL
ncbi:MAG: LytTR family DNA-binding domain-containing protein [Cyclobacteriaceae bacterium]|jgi:DNA-binding LytR/AlgR family response regulator|nr:LytTR family DNA-binding domain-containing protein [Flammeovirgaceae bacterium]MCZ8023097.1 LytTR family DNA-binding domain-containing protein [Cytophagales bacterium]MCZ8329171.1 LytTR family DNA-binding domain-containing protein [Cyclobacteriaceae bacterium]